MQSNSGKIILQFLTVFEQAIYIMQVENYTVGQEATGFLKNQTALEYQPEHRKFGNTHSDSKGNNHLVNLKESECTPTNLAFIQVLDQASALVQPSQGHFD